MGLALRVGLLLSRFVSSLLPGWPHSFFLTVLAVVTPIIIFTLLMEELRPQTYIRYSGLFILFNNVT